MLHEPAHIQKRQSCAQGIALKNLGSLALRQLSVDVTVLLLDPN